MPATFETKRRPSSERGTDSRGALPPAVEPSDCLDQLLPTSTIDTSEDSQKLTRPELVDRESRIVWPYIIGVIVFHLAIPLAFIPYFFSWWGLLWLPVGNYIF